VRSYRYRSAIVDKVAFVISNRDSHRGTTHLNHGTLLAFSSAMSAGRLTASLAAWYNAYAHQGLFKSLSYFVAFALDPINART